MKLVDQKDQALERLRQEVAALKEKLAESHAALLEVQRKYIELLEQKARRPKRVTAAERAKILELAAQGYVEQDIAQIVERSRATVYWVLNYRPATPKAKPKQVAGLVSE